jgi:hypothetical protein
MRRSRQRREAAAEMGDEMAIRSMAIPRKRALAYLEKRGIPVTNDAEMFAALEPVIAHMLQFMIRY